VRLFCELFLAAVLIWLGWTKSFHDRIDQMRGIQPAPALQQRARETTAAATTAGETMTTTTTAPAPRQPFVPRYAPARPSSTPSGDWMWDPSHRHPLDRPAYKTDNAQQQSNQNYWIDSRGVRHSVNATPPPAPSP
jgi:hypothetical protein